MKVALNEIKENLCNLNYKIEINGTEYSIEQSLDGDMAWLKTERGLNGCNSNHPCVQCGIPKVNFHNHNFSLLKKLTDNLLRSVDESKLFSLDTNKIKERYLHEPIFDFISFKNVHIDPLHEHIRIPSHLLNLTYRKLISFDNSKSFDLNKLRP